MWRLFTGAACEQEPAVKEALASQPLEGASYSLAAVRDWAPAAELDEAQRRQLPHNPQSGREGVGCRLLTHGTGPVLAL